MSEMRLRSWWNLPGHIRDLSQLPTGRVQLGLYAGLAIILFAAGGLIDRLFLTPLEITPKGQRFGWNEQLAKAEAPRIAAGMPKFAVTDADGRPVSGAGQFAELWKFGQLANSGSHIPTWKQESGDCVSMGWSNAIAYRQAFQIANEHRNESLKVPFPPYMYGVSRVLIGKRQLGRGAGSIGAWAAQGSLSYGVLPVEQATQLGFSYSGKLADQWGWTGPPKDTTDYGSRFRIKTVSQVRSWEDVRDALVHGYPVTVASNVGFDGGAYDRDGKRWLRVRGNWGHQMCFIGAEDRIGRVKGAYCLNSWGADAHQKPLNGEPPGGFWVDSATVQKMVGQGDSWAYSDFDGFPAEAVADWNKFRARVTEPDEQAELAAVDEPDPQPLFLEVRKMFAPSLLMLTLMIGVSLFAFCLQYKYSQKTKTALTLLLAASLLTIGASADAGYRARRQRFTEPSCANCSNCSNGICTSGNSCASGTCKLGQICVNGVCRPASAPATSPLKIELASNEKEIPLAVWNAFAARAATQSEPVQSWNAMEPTHQVLRTYKDCYESEADFVLVIGSRGLAEKHLTRSERPVAYEASLKGIEPGEYRIFNVPGLGLRISPLAVARHLAQTSRPRPRGQ
jgi:hypothetical protein